MRRKEQTELVEIIDELMNVETHHLNVLAVCPINADGLCLVAELRHMLLWCNRKTNQKEDKQIKQGPKNDLEKRTNSIKELKRYVGEMQKGELGIKPDLDGPSFVVEKEGKTRS